MNILVSAKDCQAFKHQVQTSVSREFMAFQNMFDTLLAEHKGEFVAISEGELVDQDKDEFALAERVSRKFRGKFVFIQQVRENPRKSISVAPRESGL